MIKFSKRYVNTVSIIITILIYFLLQGLILNQQKNIEFTSILNIFKRDKVQVALISNSVEKETEENNQASEIISKKNKYDNKNNSIQNNPITPNINETEEKINWRITIPSISLNAEISEGTEKQVMDKFVGHFEDTAIINGNVGLAAHNRGYAVNYFSNLKKVKEGDEIEYQYKNEKKTYIVTKNIVIKDVDWSYLQDTKENKITLITCIENEPNYRRCVQGTEIAENYIN